MSEFKLRPYQQKIKQDCYEAWKKNPHSNNLIVMPTGGGKTLTFSSIAQDMSQIYPTAIMVHRKELVQQICLTLASAGLEHNVIAPSATIRAIISAQRTLYKRQFYNYKAPITVLSVDTLNARILKHQDWARGIKFWICDEAAHVLQKNKWGEAISYFPNARGLGVTATPQRLDRRGLGRHADGVFDVMIEGPRTRWLIENNFLSRYMIAIPESNYRKYLAESKGDTDYSKATMLEAARKSQIVGDVFANYKKHADGTQAIIFADSIETGKRLEEKFNANRVTAKLLTSDNSDEERFKSLNDYRSRKIKVLINIDLFDEGLDVPGIDTVIMARPTKSLGKYLQMVGRGLRIAEGKPHLILIDHVGNVDEHGLPDSIRRWSLNRVAKRRTAGTSLVQLCRNVVCNRPFERLETVCPYCGTEVQRPEPGESGRIGPKQVDGDLVLLDPDVLRELEAAATLENPAELAARVGAAAGPMAAQRALQNQIDRIATQRTLVETIGQWAGVWRAAGLSDRTIHKKFFLQFDMTIHEALAMSRADMESINARVLEEITHD
jgi:superfamily II DNA or RNA helicase